MMNMKLDYDEGILLDNESVSWASKEDIELTKLVLTNKNIYCFCEKSNGFFKKSTEEVIAFALSDIKIINGQALVQQMKRDGHWCLQIQFRQGTESFYFKNSPKKVIPQWVNNINKSMNISNVLDDSASISVFKPDTSKRKIKFGDVFSGAVDVFTGVTDSIKEVVDDAFETLGIDIDFKGTKDEVEDLEVEYEDKIQPEEVEKQSKESQEIQKNFCINCGAQLDLSAKFCSSCGNKVDAVEVSPEPVVKRSELTPPPILVYEMHNVISSSVSTSQRKQEFVGTVMKCPNCGCVIGETMVVCPDCGIEISGRLAVSSARAFKDQLLAIESTRKGSRKIFDFNVDPADMKKLSLIRSFPIPNSVGDVLEFMLLAATNIEVNLSKQTAKNILINWGEFEVSSTNIRRVISDAWVAKMQQAYQKAEIMFPNDPRFQGIQKIYYDKMKELKIKVKKS